MGLASLFIVYSIVMCCKRQKKEDFVKNMVVSFIVIIFLAHPTLTSNAFSMMNCYEIEPGEQWLQADLEVMCWNSVHLKWFLGVGLPMLVIWVIGMPLIAFLILFCNRKRLNDEHFFDKYRMLYQGLKSERYYWEIVNSFRKISIVSINVFLALYPDYIKAIYAILTLAMIFRL